MRIVVCIVALTLAGEFVGAQGLAEPSQRFLKSDDYTVAWGEPAKYDADSELEVGDAHGHGGGMDY